VEVVGEGTLMRKPVDVIVVIDNSSSMGEEIAGVVANISTNFTDILTTSGIDWRIILLSFHGDPTDDPPGSVDRPICMPMPLSGTSCVPVPAMPALTTRFFQYQVGIDSEDSLTQVLATFDQADPFGLAPNGWQDWLRPDAQRVFLEITDDRSEMSADEFETALFALTPVFGDASARNYVFHSIIGIREKPTPTDAWTPGEPLQGADCPSAAAPAPQYEELSIRTGGLRFPVCQTASYDAVFQQIAMGVIEGSQVQCSFAAPEPPMGELLDLERVVVLYEPGTGGSTTFSRVAAAGDCADGAFYVEGSTITLCDQTCQAVQADSEAHLEVHVACQSPGVD
jgi:hypothetical protein